MTEKLTLYHALKYMQATVLQPLLLSGDDAHSSKYLYFSQSITSH